LPAGLPVGSATIEINTNTDDNIAVVTAGPVFVSIEIVSGVGASDEISYQESLGGDVPAELSRLEPAPYAKINFGSYQDFPTLIGAVSMIVDFDETIVDPGDINVYMPESTVKGNFGTADFGGNQRMVHWRQDGQQLYIDIIAPQGINRGYLHVYLIHPRGLSASPGFTLLQVNGYAVDGTDMALTPTMNYYP